MNNKKFTVQLNPRSVDAFAKKIDRYEKSIQRKSKILAKRLAELGVTHAELLFSTAQYDGINDYTITAKKISDTEYKVSANGTTVLFVEFGTGITYANPPHPEQGEFGAGTYEPNYGHWNDPEGWFLPRSRGERTHTFGNPPNAPMYNTVKWLERSLELIVQEVFAK